MDEYRVGTVSPTEVLVWGIIGAAASEIPIAGLVLAIIARGKVKKYGYENGNVFSGKTKAGQILSIVGLVSAICWQVFWLCYAVFFGWLFSNLLSDISRYRYY